jgi:hypothetical protein
MARNQKEIEDALFQIKNLEESLQRNAQGILSSTMREEINSLVKESLREQDEIEDEDEEEVEVELDDTDTDNEEDTDNLVQDVDDTVDIENDMVDLEMPSDDDTVDLTQASDSEVLRVFRAMGDNDGVIVKRDDNMIHLSDSENDAEYIIQLSESMMDDSEIKEFGKSEFDMYSHHFGDKEEDEDDDEYFDFEEDEEEEDDDYMPMNKLDMGIREKGMLNQDPMAGKFKSSRFKDEEEDLYDDDFKYSSLGEEESFENIYEIELDDFDLSDIDLNAIEDSEMFRDEIGEEELEPQLALKSDPSKGDAGVMESVRKAFKAKGTGMGNASKYRMSKKPNMEGGFKTVKKKTNKTMGTGRAKFEYKEEVNGEGFGKKIETKEASRTYGNGGLRGLRKGITPNRNLKENDRELELLKSKNDEYRKALDLFRTKLNEVAVFNSNLAYATRLFTEHSTTKQEKINILRRFDNAETLKESKNLYKSIKSELGSEKTSENTITESVQRNVERTPSTGSAVNLIESKTYENPQFLRMKDLMAKIK